METLAVASIVAVAAVISGRRGLVAWRRLRRPATPGCGGSCPGCGPGKPEQLVQLGRRSATLAVIVALGLGGSRAALASDTVETWEPGATDVDFYLGVDRALSGGQGSGFGDIMFGHGLIDRMSAYMGATLQGDSDLGHGQAGLSLGVFGTPIDTRHLDFDLLLHLAADGPGLTELCVAPGFELNVDADPDRRTWGAYLRTRVYLRHDSSHVVPTVGSYRRIDRHELLLEVEADHHAGAGNTQLTGVALGSNRVLSPELELISQVRVTPPLAGAPTGFGVVAGFIATLPAR